MASARSCPQEAGSRHLLWSRDLQQTASGSQHSGSSSAIYVCGQQQQLNSWGLQGKWHLADSLVCILDGVLGRPMVCLFLQWQTSVFVQSSGG